MKLYFTNSNPLTCAEDLDDRLLAVVPQRVKDMLRMLLVTDFTEVPVMNWARESQSNAYWVIAHGVSACEEYSKRTGKVAAERDFIEKFPIIQVNRLPDTRVDRSNLSKERWFPKSFPVLIGRESMSDVFIGYRVLLNDEWDAPDAPPVVWTNRAPPKWTRWKYIREEVKSDEVAHRYHYEQRNERVRLGDDKA